MYPILTNLGIDFRLQSLYNHVIKPMSKFVDNSEKLKYDGIGEHTFALLI